MNLLKRKVPEPSTQAVRQDRQEREQKEKLVEGVRRGWWRKIDVSKLTLAEAEELRELFRKARGDAHYPREGLDLLGVKERDRVHALLDKCLPDADRQRARKVAEQRAERELENLAIAALAAGVPPRLRSGIEPGESVLPREAVEIGTLNVGDLGLLAVLLYAWSSGNAGVFRGGRWAEDGTALLIPRKPEFANRDLLVDYEADGRVRHIINVASTLEHVRRNGFLVLSREPRGGLAISLGERLGGWSG